MKELGPMPDFVSSSPFLVVTGVVILMLILAFVASRYKVAGANEAIIVAGSRGAKVHDERGQQISSPGDKGVKVVVGGGTIVMPLLNRVGRLKLTARQINVQLSDAVTSQGIKVQVQGVATFKIGRDVESLRNAAERFLDAKPEQVDSIVKNVLEGSLRSIVGTLTIEELIRDRQKLLQQVQDAAKGDLATSGLQIDAFTIQSFSDESNYIELLGQQSVATVTRDARMAKATTDQEAAVREADAETTRLEGGAEAQIVLTKGEAEAKALAMRADAYKQFNEAAIIQTVLAALPEIVKAAAEPMGHINSLTVMSAEGASDLVKNATRAVIESTTAIKGLTGLDVPSLVGGALGRGFVDRGRTSEGDGHEEKEGSAIDRINATAHEGLTTMPKRTEEAVTKAEAAVQPIVTATTVTAKDVAASTRQAAAAVEKAAGAVQAKAAAVVTKVAPSEGTVLQWAQWTADQLRQVPTIELFNTMKLQTLIDHGPPQAEAIWHTAQAALGRDYGDMTVGDLLKRFGPKS